MSFHMVLLGNGVPALDQVPFQVQAGGAMHSGSGCLTSSLWSGGWQTPGGTMLALGLGTPRAGSTAFLRLGRHEPVPVSGFGSDLKWQWLPAFWEGLSCKRSSMWNLQETMGVPRHWVDTLPLHL